MPIRGCAPQGWLKPEPSPLPPPLPQAQVAEEQAAARSRMQQLEQSLRAAEWENRDWHAVAMGAEAQAAQLEERLWAEAGRADEAERRAWELEQRSSQACSGKVAVLLAGKPFP